jgi:pyruvate dehydrogenase E2 component (dihydrolipoamide acetyltransferase)
MGEFRMPSLGADMTEGTLLEWLVQPGDRVRRGDIVAVVDTSKSAIDIEVFEGGTVTELLVEPGTTVAVGAPLALLSTDVSPDVAASAPAVPTTTGEASEPARAAPAPPVSRPPVVRDAAHIPASPFARRRAAELGVDLATVTGHGGVISVADVEAAAGGVAPPPPAAAPAAMPAVGDHAAASPMGDHAAASPMGDHAAASPMGDHAAASPMGDHAAAMRQAIAALMARSKREIPHYYLQSTIDMHVPLGWLADVNAGRPVADRILPAALLLKAVAVAARDFGEMNGFLVDGVFRPSEHVHLGVAVSLRGGGLIAPALHDADVLPLDEVMRGMKDLVTRARSGRLRSSEMSDPTLTVTNLGEQGAEAVHGVIYPPQVALVGFGRIVDRPWAVDGMLAVHPVLTVTLAADHRVSDGHRGGLFLVAIDEALQDPDALRGGMT